MTSPPQPNQQVMDEVRAKARSRVRRRIGFMWHFVVFLMTNLSLFAINRVYSPNVTWFVWPLGAWGAGLALHALATFQGAGMTEEMIEEEVRRELRRRDLQ